MQKLLVAVVALALVAAVAVGFLLLDSDAPAEVAAVSSAPTETVESPRTDAVIAPPTMATEELAVQEGTRKQVEAVVEVEVDAEEAATLAPPDAAKSRWVELVVHLPSAAPADGTLVALALDGPKTFEDLYGEKGIVPERQRLGRDTSYKGLVGVFAVDSAGRARVAFPKEVANPHVAVSGKYVYSDGAYAVDAASGRAEVRSELGAFVTGRILPPVGSQAEWKEEVSVRLTTDLADVNSWEGNTRRLNFTQEVKVGSRFEFQGIPTAKSLTLGAKSDELATSFQEGLKLEAGKRLDVDVQMLAGARIVGRVLDDDGKPVADAEVEARTREFWGMPVVELREAETDAEGHYELAAVKPGEVWITVEQDGFLEYKTPSSFTIANGEEHQHEDIALSEGGSFSGFVMFPDGKPAAGAKLEVEIDLSQNMQGTPVGPEASSGSGTKTEADATGAFALRGLGTGPFSVKAELEVTGDGDVQSGRWTSRLDALTPSLAAAVEQIHLVLVPPMSLSGFVRDTAGVPVPAFEVVAERAGSQWYMPPSARESKEFLSEDGAFTLPNLSAGEWKLFASSEGFASSEPLELELPKDKDQLLEIALARPASIAGTVVDPDGQPVAGAEVGPEADFVELIARSQGRGDSGPNAVTDGSGHFLLEGLAPGSGTLRAEKEGYARSAGFAYDLESSEVLGDAVLELRRGGTITGEVLGDDGEPAAGAQVFVQQQTTFQRRSVKTDEDGLFRADHLEPATWQVTSMNFDDTGGDFSEALETLKMTMVELEDEAEVHVVLGKQPENPVQVFGRITAAGKPVDEMLISFVPTRGGGMDALRIKTVDDDGRYRVTLEEPGDYLVTLQQVAGMEQNSEEHRYRIPDVDEFELDFELPLGRITGRVIGPDGQPKPGIVVTLNIDGGVVYGTVFGGQYTQTSTDDTGAYEIEHLRAGVYRVAVGGVTPFGDQGALGRTVTRVDVREGQWLRDVDFELEMPGKVHGIVKDHAGRPVEKASVFVRDEQGNLLEVFSFTATDAGGRFDYEGLAPGRYTISARTDALTSGEDVVVEVESDQRAEVELVMDTGTLLVVSIEDKSGELVPAMVSVTDDRGREVTGMKSIQDIVAQYNGGLGSLEQNVGPLSAGVYTVRAVTQDGRSAKRPVTLAPGQAERKLRMRLEN